MGKYFYSGLIFAFILILLRNPKPVLADNRFCDDFSGGMAEVDNSWQYRGNEPAISTVTDTFAGIIPPSEKCNPNAGQNVSLRLATDGINDTYVAHTLPSAAPGSLEVIFYDYGPGTNAGFLISAGSGTPLSPTNLFGFGVHSNVFPNTYYYRTGLSGNQYADSGIPRVEGYHKLILRVTPFGSWAEVAMDLNNLGNKIILNKVATNPMVNFNWIELEGPNWNTGVRNAFFYYPKIILPGFSHQIKTDSSGLIAPWYSSDPGTSYDHILGLLWNYWSNVPVGKNGVKNYLQNRTAELDWGIAVYQLPEALSSWRLLYQYSGDGNVLNNMTSIADFYLANGLSASNTLWPNLTFPYNSDNIGPPTNPPPVGPGFYYGDLERGRGVTQPDKAGAFGSELVPLYEITGNTKYLNAAINIANTLAAKVRPGDGNNSPLPFRVNVNTGAIPDPVDSYSSNWMETLTLFDELIKLNAGNTAGYISAKETISNWLKNYPMKTNKWGPTFEDVGTWSDTEMNADNLAFYILENPGWDTNWKQDVRNILDWTENTFGNTGWEGINWGQYGVVPLNEQTAFMVPGNSHTARHGTLELLYAAETGDMSRKAASVRQLNWATYTVDWDGVNRYPEESRIWFSDGYGDYVRHYIRSMGAAPELAPGGQNHLLQTSSVVKNISYSSNKISYKTFDNQSEETLKINFTPFQITAGGILLPKLNSNSDLNSSQGYTFDTAGVLIIRHDQSGDIVISSSQLCDPTSWSGWGSCNKNCGGGTQSRTNACGTVQTQSCNTQACITNTPIPPNTPVPIQGDLNNDNHVNIFDYNILVTNFGKTGTAGFTPSDINRDGVVNIFDYNMLVGNFGK